MKPLLLTISTKKGESQETRWLIVQDIPYPDISAECGNLKWRNGGGLFPQYGQKADGIGKSYKAYLLCAGVADVPADWNRTHLAGYEGRPGTFLIRGKSMGEVSIEFGANPDWPTIRVHGFDTPSPGEGEAIKQLIVPPLRQFIAENRVELQREAVAKLKAHGWRKIQEAVKAVAELEKQFLAAVESIK